MLSPVYFPSNSADVFLSDSNGVCHVLVSQINHHPIQHCMSFRHTCSDLELTLDFVGAKNKEGRNKLVTCTYFSI